MMKNCLYIIAAFGLITNASYAGEPEKAKPVDQQEVKKNENSPEQQLATLSVTIEEEKKEDSEEAKKDKLAAAFVNKNEEEKKEGAEEANKDKIAVGPVSTKEVEEDQESEDEQAQAVLATAPVTSEKDEEESKKNKSENLLAGCANGKCPYSNINDDETTTYDGRSGAQNLTRFNLTPIIYRC